MVYRELATDMPMGPVIRKLKEFIYPPFRPGVSRFHMGDFGYPDGLDDYGLRVYSYKVNKELRSIEAWRDEQGDSLDVEELKEMYKNTLLCDLGMFIFEDDEHLEYYEERLEEIPERASVMYNDWMDYWVYHFTEKDEIYELMMEEFDDVGKQLEYVLENGIEEAYMQFSDQQRVLDFMLGVGADYGFESDYVDYILNRDEDYKVGDYFYHYYYENEFMNNRQYHGIAAVSYDIKTERKVAIFDTEGRPEWPAWLREQFQRFGIRISYPEL